MSTKAKKILVLLALALLVGLVAHTSPGLHADHDEHGEEYCPACVLLASFVLLVIVAAVLASRVAASQFTYHIVAPHLLLDSLLSQRGPPVTLQ